MLRDDEGNEHPLASSEFALLKAFAENPRRVLSRERLLDLANARDREAFDRAIDVRITRIRRKIEPDPAHPSVIRTVRGAGYLFSPDGSEPESGILPLEGVEPPGHRRDRHPALRHEAVGGPGRIAPRMHRARHPFARAAFVAVLHLLELGHQHRHALGRHDDERRQRAARDREFLRVERGARHRQRAFDIAGRLLRQRLHAREPVARGIAGPQMRVGLGEIGMRIGLPRRLDDARRPCADRRPRRGAARPAPRPAPASARASPLRARRQRLGASRSLSSAASARAVSSTARWRR